MRAKKSLPASVSGECRPRGSTQKICQEIYLDEEHVSVEYREQVCVRVSVCGSIGLDIQNSKLSNLRRSPALFFPLLSSETGVRLLVVEGGSIQGYNNTTQEKFL